VWGVGCESDVGGRGRRVWHCLKVLCGREGVLSEGPQSPQLAGAPTHTFALKSRMHMHADWSQNVWTPGPRRPHSPASDLPWLQGDDGGGAAGSGVHRRTRLAQARTRAHTCTFTHKSSRMHMHADWSHNAWIPGPRPPHSPGGILMQLQGDRGGGCSARVEHPWFWGGSLQCGRCADACLPAVGARTCRRRPLRV